MLSYLSEGSYSNHNGISNTPRFLKDFPIANDKIKDAIINNPKMFAKNLVEYIYDDISAESFYNSYPVDDFERNSLRSWAGYRNKQYIKNIIEHIENEGGIVQSYISGQSKIGIAPTQLCQRYLLNRFPNYSEKIGAILDSSQYPECVIMPLRIHKSNNNTLTFSPDPESGEIVAFGELFGKDYRNRKIRPIIGYVIVNTPEDFDLNSKIGTKLYKALSHYIDILILNDTTIITEYSYEIIQDDYKQTTLYNIKPKSWTEEMAIVSTYLNQSTLNANWQLCFIHTHHSSWQQMMVYKPNGECNQHKIDRVSTKVDLIMQNDNQFMIAEGKDAYTDLIRDRKIRTAMINAGQLIDQLYCAENKKFNAFIYNLHTAIDPEYYIDREVGTVTGAIERGHFNNIASEKDFVVIIVTTVESKTQFSLVYSPDFDKQLKHKLDTEFKQ